MTTRFDLFYSAPCEEFKQVVSDGLKSVFSDIVIMDRGIKPVFEGALNIRRRQLDAYMLLDNLIRCMSSDCAVWLVDRDIFCENVNFVFGLAMYNIAAVVSNYRLDSPEMVVKEAAHEVGHVLGLRHCKNHCVMQFSNSLEEATMKPSTLCAKCKNILDRKIVEQRAPI